MNPGDKVFACDSNMNVRIGYFVGDTFNTGFQFVVSTNEAIVGKITQQSYNTYKSQLYFAYGTRIFAYKTRSFRKYRNSVSYFLKNTEKFMYKFDYPVFFDLVLDNKYRYGRIGLWLDQWSRRAWTLVTSIIKALIELIFLPITVIVNYVQLNIATNNNIREINKEREVLRIKKRMSMPQNELDASKAIISEYDIKSRQLKEERKELRNIFIAILLPVIAAIIPIFLQNSSNNDEKNSATAISLIQIGTNIEKIAEKIEHLDRNIDFHLEKK